jgi:hypothetical protein
MLKMANVQNEIEGRGWSSLENSWTIILVFDFCFDER